MTRPCVYFLLACALFGCNQPQQTPFAATLPGNQTVSNIGQVATPVPTAHVAPSRTPTLPPTPTFTPSQTPTITPSPTITWTPSPIGSATPTDPSSDPENTPPPTWTPPPRDPSVEIADHYRMGRPIAENGVNWVDRTYPYGSTGGGRLPVHHGVEFVNPRGTTVVAVADGVVIHAGDDASIVVGPFNNYYGNVVVIEHSFTAPEGSPVYSVYGHLQRVTVETGETVQRGDPIGAVGDSGVALGPHLHFEVRMGDPFEFGATRNPELWISPFGGFGTLAGRVTDQRGNRLYDVTIHVESDEMTRRAFSYADNTVNRDPAFGENFTLGDLPAGYYEVTVRDNGRLLFQRIVYVYPNRTTWIEIELE